ncbi:hypothetical protein G7Y89_g7995 [Cudoniella acicularis]|uniref:Uncharacterized protein n=1 Tax=Cudoniella acicularis TaxID=354080 RepID=A0A8H4W1I3_9HELO|nr:hypothetical protein G7Y89_g7995 [Cudoniella acicularis]
MRKPHRSDSTWNKDITLLTCIFYLRYQPSVPFEDIAEHLLTTCPTRMIKLAEDTEKEKMTKEERVEWIASGQMKQRLSGILKDKFEQAEQDMTRSYIMARD